MKVRAIFTCASESTREEVYDFDSSEHRREFARRADMALRTLWTVTTMAAGVNAAVTFKTR